MCPEPGAAHRPRPRGCERHRPGGGVAGFAEGPPLSSSVRAVPGAPSGPRSSLSSQRPPAVSPGFASHRGSLRAFVKRSARGCVGSRLTASPRC